MVTVEQYLEALEVIKAYRKQGKKEKITDEQLRSFLESVDIIRYNDLLKGVMKHFDVGRTYAVAVVVRMRDSGMVHQDGLRGIYLK